MFVNLNTFVVLQKRSGFTSNSIRTSTMECTYDLHVFLHNRVPCFCIRYEDSFSNEQTPTSSAVQPVIQYSEYSSYSRISLPISPSFPFAGKTCIRHEAKICKSSSLSRSSPLKHFFFSFHFCLFLFTAIRTPTSFPMCRRREFSD